jgi:hypothetical protein
MYINRTVYGKLNRYISNRLLYKHKVHPRIKLSEE